MLIGRRSFYFLRFVSVLTSLAFVQGVAAGSWVSLAGACESCHEKDRKSKGGGSGSAVFWKTGSGSDERVEKRVIELSGDPEMIVDGMRVSELKQTEDPVVVEEDREEEAPLSYYIVELEGPSLGKTDSDLKEKGVSKEQRIREGVDLKKAIAKEHEAVKGGIGKALGKELVMGHPGKGQRHVRHEFDTALNGFSVELKREEVEKVKGLSGVKRVTEDGRVEALLDESVPMISADRAWVLTDGKGASLTGYGMRIGIIDTGVDYRHPDLGGGFGRGYKVAGGYDFVNNDADPMDDHGHGTHVASTAAGKGLLLGVAPDATIYAYKVLNSGGAGYFSAIIAAIDRGMDPDRNGDLSDHLDVCSMSLGGAGNPDDALSLACDNAVRNGVVVTVAAGNSGPASGTIGTPGASRLAVTVGAACKSVDVGVNPACGSPVASFSSRGPVTWTDSQGQHQSLAKPDVVAPGVNICAAEWGSWLSTRRCKDSRHIAISGTSMATPHVAGLAALLRQAVPSASALDIKDALRRGAVAYSNLDANVQGTGLIHALGSLRVLSPDLNFSAKLSAAPFAWRLQSDVSRTLYSATQSFTVSNASATATRGTISVRDVPAGVTVVPTRTILDIPAHGSASFDVTLRADHSVLVSGEAYLPMLVVDSPLQPLYIGIVLAVPDRVSFSPLQLDFGADQPDFSGVWTSTRPITITNLQQDAPATYSLSVEEVRGPSGVVTQGLSAAFQPPSLALGPSGSGSASVTLSLDNAVLANGVYQGIIRIASPLQAPLRIPFKVYKYYRLVVTYPPIVSGSLMQVHFHDQNRMSGYSGIVTMGGSSSTFLLSTKPPVIDVLGVLASLGGTNDHTVTYLLKEDLAFSGDATVPLDPAEAGIVCPSSYVGVHGETLTARFVFQAPILKFKRNGLPGVITNYLNCFPLRFKFNRVSSDYAFSVGTVHAYPRAENEVRKVIHFEHILSDGITAGQALTNRASDLKYIPVFGYPGSNEDVSVVFTEWQPNLQGGGGMGLGFRLLAARDYRCDLYVLPVSDTLDFGKAVISLWVWLATGSSSLHELVSGPWILFQPGGLLKWGGRPIQSVGAARPVPLDPVAPAQRLDLGVLPFHFDIDWGIYPNGKTVVPPHWLNQGGRGLFMSQEWDLVRFDPGRLMPYRVFRDGLKIAEGTAGNSLDLTGIIGNTPGLYDVEFFDTVPIAGRETLHSLKGTFQLPSDFSASRLDRCPPSLRKLDFLSGGVPAQVIDPSRPYLLRFTVDPEKAVWRDSTDAVRFLSFRMKTDLSDWRPLSVTLDPVSGVYSSAIALDPDGASLYTFELVITDSSDNKMTYLFELPRGTVPMPGPGDGIPPTVSITSPVEGSSLSGTVEVIADAISNVDVLRVEFYLDNVFKGSDATSPYTLSWDTATAANGPHTLQAKGIDAAGNVEASAPVGVTVSNRERTPPVISITKPANGSLVRKNSGVTISATATDNVGVTKVEFWAGGTLIATDTTASYSCIWVSPKSVGVSTVLRATAYDAAGNSASASVTVTTK